MLILLHDELPSTVNENFPRSSLSLTFLHCAVVLVFVNVRAMMFSRTKGSDGQSMVLSQMRDHEQIQSRYHIQ